MRKFENGLQKTRKQDLILGERGNSKLETK